MFIRRSCSWVFPFIYFSRRGRNHYESLRIDYLKCAWKPRCLYCGEIILRIFTKVIVQRWSAFYKHDLEDEYMEEFFISCFFLFWIHVIVHLQLPRRGLVEPPLREWAVVTVQPGWVPTSWPQSCIGLVPLKGVGVMLVAGGYPFLAEWATDLRVRSALGFLPETSSWFSPWHGVCLFVQGRWAGRNQEIGNTKHKNFKFILRRK